MKSFELKKLPVDKNLETTQVLKKLALAHRKLAELKGVATSIPNENILINTLGLQEAKDSSAIENIITTHDDLYKAELSFKENKSLNAKEVHNYIEALKKGFGLISDKKLITNNIIIEIQSLLEGNNAGFRKVPGTALKNASTGKVIYTPLQDIAEINNLMANLEIFINDNEISTLDPLIKMSIIHYQFESIHPFYDGNGRTGRIINVLYLVLQDLLNLPILYLSKFIIANKGDYYRLLQEVRDKDEWENWILYMLDAIIETSTDTIYVIGKIKNLLAEYKHKIRNDYKFYSHDLINNLFMHPYTKIEFLEKEMGVSRITAAAYLNKLALDGLLKKEKLGTANYYVNHRLFEILSN
jgi:Fic family protein